MKNPLFNNGFFSKEENMIYTVTFNPSIDYFVDVDEFKIGNVNRTLNDYILPGGKGINVSIVLNNLGIESRILGFIAGFTGKEIKNQMENIFHIHTDFINLNQGYSRINVKMRGKKESEINAVGPVITSDDLNLLFSQLDSLKEGDILVLSGSVPKSLSNNNIYKHIMKRMNSKNVYTIVDAEGDLLLSVLEEKPFLVKPNHHELEKMFHVKHLSDEEIIFYGRKLQNMGAQNVLISMAEKGAILITQEDNIYQAVAPKGKVKNSVGAGDSMVAGFIAGYNTKKDFINAFQVSIATGSATAFSDGLAKKDEVESLLSKIDIIQR